MPDLSPSDPSADFWAIVGPAMDPDTPVEVGPDLPSGVTRRMWAAVADTYDAAALRPLWAYTAEQMRAVSRMSPSPRPGVKAVLQSSAIAIAVAHRLEGVEPASDLTTIGYAYARLGDHVCWGTLQQAVEALATRWEALEQNAPTAWGLT